MYTVWKKEWNEELRRHVITQIDTIDKYCNASEYLKKLSDEEREKLGICAIIITETYDEGQAILSVTYTV